MRKLYCHCDNWPSPTDHFYLHVVFWDHILNMLPSPMLRMTLLMPEMDSASHISSKKNYGVRNYISHIIYVIIGSLKNKL